jgi:YegS/Rv2252/BmrU family lipid kinase
VNIHLIANPVSGGDARPRIARTASWLRDQGAHVEVHLTDRRGDARRLAAAAVGHCDRVVVAGGDGTLNEVANALHGTQLPVAFIPLGTVNVFALETGIPLALETACRLALDGRPRPISLGRIDDQVFLLMASAGWDAEAVTRLHPALKRRLGRLAYAVSAVEALLARPPAPVTIILADGSRHSGFGVVVSNARCYGGRYMITPRASLLSPRLEVGLLRRGGRLAMLDCALRLGLHRPLPAAAIEYYEVDAVELSGTGVAVQVDGDAWGKLPVRIVALPRALQVVLPETFREDAHDGTL